MDIIMEMMVTAAKHRFHIPSFFRVPHYGCYCSNWMVVKISFLGFVYSLLQPITQKGSRIFDNPIYFVQDIQFTISPRISKLISALINLTSFTLDIWNYCSYICVRSVKENARTPEAHRDRNGVILCTVHGQRLRIASVKELKIDSYI